MKRKNRIKEVRSLFKAHSVILIVFALLTLVPFIPHDIVGSSIIYFNDSNSNATETLTELIISDINISIETSNETIEMPNESSTIESNISEEIVNESIMENITETPIEPIQNTTEPEINVTESNISETIPEVNISTPENVSIIEEKVTQYQAVIGQPVKWKKVVKLDQESSNVEIELPKDGDVCNCQQNERDKYGVFY